MTSSTRKPRADNANGRKGKVPKRKAIARTIQNKITYPGYLPGETSMLDRREMPHGNLVTETTHMGHMGQETLAFGNSGNILPRDNLFGICTSARNRPGGESCPVGLNATDHVINCEGGPQLANECLEEPAMGIDDGNIFTLQPPSNLCPDIPQAAVAHYVPAAELHHPYPASTGDIERFSITPALLPVSSILTQAGSQAVAFDKKHAPPSFNANVNYNIANLAAEHADIFLSGANSEQFVTSYPPAYAKNANNLTIQTSAQTRFFNNATFSKRNVLAKPWGSPADRPSLQKGKKRIQNKEPLIVETNIEKSPSVLHRPGTMGNTWHEQRARDKLIFGLFSCIRTSDTDSASYSLVSKSPVLIASVWKSARRKLNKLKTVERGRISRLRPFLLY